MSNGKFELELDLDEPTIIFLEHETKKLGVSIDEYVEGILVNFLSQKVQFITRGFEVVKDEFRSVVDVQLPKRADKGSCAYDIYSPSNYTIYPNEQLLIWTDVKAYMQENEVLVVNVRSSQGKLRVQLANTQGWVDSSYYSNVDNDGNIGIFLRNEGSESYVIKQGDRIAQAMFINCLIADEDNVMNSERTGGLGSTGK